MIKLELLTMPSCPHCEKAKELLKKIKPDFPNLKIKITDISKNPRIAQKYKLMVAPGIVINGKLEFTGVPKEEELRKKLR